MRSPMRKKDKNYVARDEIATRVTSQLLSVISKEVVPIQLLAIKILWALSTDTSAAKEIAAKVCFPFDAFAGCSGHPRLWCMINVRQLDTGWLALPSAAAS